MNKLYFSTFTILFLLTGTAIAEQNMICGFETSDGGIVCDVSNENNCSENNGILYPSSSECWEEQGKKAAFSSSCAIIQRELIDTTYTYEIWHGGTMKKDDACQIDNAKVQVINGEAHITQSNIDTITVVASEGAKFIVIAEKGNRSISREVQVLDGTSQECTITSKIMEDTVQFDISGEGSSSQSYCHFDGNSHNILSGDAKLITMTEFSLTFDAMKKGRIRILAASPSTYSIEYETNGGKVKEPSDRSIPPAGYEDEVLTKFNDYDNPFPDTEIDNLIGMAAAELYRRAIIGGYPDGEFKGNQNVNRAEASKFLLLARYGTVNEISNSGKFPDVLDGQWYTKYVVTAADKGIINGHPDGTFRPADTVNTAEFLKMLSLTFGLQLNLPHSFSDVSTEDWFAIYAGTAEEYNLFPSRSQYLLPSDTLTREEVAVAIYQFLQNR